MMSKTQKIGTVAGSLVILALVAFAIIHLMSQITDLKDQAAKEALAKRELQAANLVLDEDIKNAKHRLAECTKKIADPAKRNVSDMQSYIMARYSKVPSELAALIAQKTNEIADKHDVDFAVVVGLMDVESAFNPFAVSKKDARGLMQVMFKVWGKKYNIARASDLHDIERNIDIGVQILKHYIDKSKGNVSKALTAYNGGGKTYANDVYIAIGRFTAFRNNTYEDEEEEEDKPAPEPIVEMTPR